MITIILVTYNMAEYLPRCIQSIINQTYKDIELIIVDDGSTDDSAEILDGFQQGDPRVRVIHQENKGHSEARNVGMDNARGDYYYFIDADDYIHEQTIEVLWNNMQESGADISIGDITRTEPPTCSLDAGYDTYSSIEALRILTDYHSGMPLNKLPFNVTWNKIFKANLFKDVRFPTGHVRDDNFTCHRLLYNANKIVLSKARTYFYTYQAQSMSNDGLYKNKDLILAHKDRIAFFKEKGLIELLPDACSYFLNVCLKTFDAMKDYSIIREVKGLIKNNELQFTHNHMGLQHKKEIENMKDIIIYVGILNTRDGIYTWIRNFCLAFKDQYEIMVVSQVFSHTTKNELSECVECEIYDKSKTYVCNTLLHNFIFDAPCDNIKAVDTYIVLHRDYGRWDKEIKFDMKQHYIAVSDVVTNGVHEKYGLDCKTIVPFVRTHSPEKIYKFVSATRINEEKGYKRMLQLCQLLKETNVHFQWLIFCQRDMMTAAFRSEYPELIYANEHPNESIQNYMADADYTIQLSSEESFCFAIHESLKVGTPVIVTDIPVFRNLVRDSYNGYRVSLDMENIDINKILTEIPKDFIYDDHYEELKNEWIKILN